MHPFCLVTERVEVLPYALCLLLYFCHAALEKVIACASVVKLSGCGLELARLFIKVISY
jgi:hypothetical protein